MAVELNSVHNLSSSSQLSVSLNLGPVQIEVVFGKQHDRYAHVVRAVSTDGDPPHWTTLLDSVEGTPQQNWPTSPPLQACQAIADDTLLATGMAGASHWSLAVTRGTSKLAWDVACRFKQKPGQIGSTYHSSAHVAEWQTEAVLLDIGESCDFQVALRCSPTEETACQLLRMDQNQLILQPTCHPASPGTARWKYELEIVPR